MSLSEEQALAALHSISDPSFNVLIQFFNDQEAAILESLCLPDLSDNVRQFQCGAIASVRGMRDELVRLHTKAEA